jgi:hypothetical protein
VLTGSADPERLAANAATLASFACEPVTLERVETLQLLAEIESAGMEGLLPPGLHPTLPPAVTWLVQRVGASPWGAFQIAQCRIECRSGLRPRGFLRGGVIDNEAAAAALAAGWGYGLRRGAIRLRRSYDEVHVAVSVDGREVLDGLLRDPQPLRGEDVFIVANVNLARTPRGLRLVQVDPDYAVERAERGTPVVRHFDAEAWGSAGVRPCHPVSALFHVAAMTLPAVRYVCRPDLLAFAGTERVDRRAAAEPP